MDFSRLLTRRNLVIAGIAAGILLVLIIMIIGMRAPRSVSLNFAKMAFQYPLAIDNKADGTLVFSNGRSFVSYAPASGEAKRLTPPAELPTIGTLLLRPDGSGALFQTVNHSTTDILSQSLTQRSLTLDAPYWWYVDFAKNSYTLVAEPQHGSPQKFRVAQWLDNDSFLGATPLGTQTQFSTQIPTGQIKQDFLLNGAIDSFTIRGDQLRYQNGDKLYQTQMGTNQPTELLSSIVNANFSPKNDWVYVVERSDNSNSNPSYLYNTATKQKTFETVAAEQAPYWSTDGNWLFLSTASGVSGKQIGMRAINVNDLRQTNYSSDSTDLSLERTVFAENDQLFVAVDSKLNLYFASTDQNTQRKFTIKDTQTVSNDTISIDYFANEGYFIASVTGNDSPQVREQAEKMLGETGVTPEFVQMRMTFLPPIQRDGPQ